MRKRLRIPSRTNLRRYIVYNSRLSTLPSRKQTSLYMMTSAAGISRRTYVRTLISPNRYKMYRSVPPVPFWSCLHQKNTKFFGFTRLFDLSMKIHFKTWRNRLRIPSRTNLRRYIFYHSRFLHPDRNVCCLYTTHGFSTLAVNNKPEII